ncbi:MAG TPA: beta-ketoacyl-ACP reductase [Lentisphaeria bacterium]|nr:MAG: beta-ketoacyl-ACP reductase [Lentisphaerae bacterium GWF2_49_21]HBC89745.1 beta-ketoacyl-ACP reductase [Lentisphaeria bacterium]
MKFDFKEYNVVVTGGTRGIGKAVTEAFLKAGASVTAIFHGNQAAADQLKQAWAGHPLEIVKFDISDYSQAESFYKEYDAKHKSLEVLVNNAGIRKDNVLGMMPPQDWNAVIATNLTGTFNMSKFAVQKMMQNKFGRIINITSPSGKFGFAGQSNYAAAKAGQVALTMSLAKETARRGITVNAVSPGFIDTEFIGDLPEEAKKAFIQQIPLKRFGRPEEVANAILFLASKESSYVTGSVLEVTGGL